MSKILILPGDGIGPEIIAQAEKVLQCLRAAGLSLELETALIGGCAYDKSQSPLPAETIALADAADAVLLGAVGGPQYDQVPRDLRPEQGLLDIRAKLNLFANLRPALLYAELAAASSLKPELVADLDLLIVRELTGGIYFGQPRGREMQGSIRRAYNTMVYDENEIARIAHVAFKAAEKRNNRLCSVEKANVLQKYVADDDEFEIIEGDKPCDEDRLYTELRKASIASCTAMFNAGVNVEDPSTFDKG